MDNVSDDGNPLPVKSTCNLRNKYCHRFVLLLKRPVIIHEPFYLSLFLLIYFNVRYLYLQALI